MCVEACEARGSPGFEISARLDRRELSECPSHRCRGQWLDLELLEIVLIIVT